MGYIVNLLLLTNECQQRSSTDCAHGVAHNTSRNIPATIANFSRSLRLWRQETLIGGKRGEIIEGGQNMLMRSENLFVILRSREDLFSLNKK